MAMEVFTRIPIASYIFLGLFFAISIWHIYLCCVRQNSFLRKATKSFCVLTLAIAVIIALPTYPLIYIGLLAGAIGDFLLIFKKKPVLFILGAVFFLVNHILIIIQGILLLQPFTTGITIGAICFLVIAFITSYIIAFTFLKKPKRSVPGGIYVTALMVNIGLYLLAVCMGRYEYFLICLFGAVSFMASDMLLAYSLFVKGNQKSRHLVMATYLIGQFLIAFGYILTLLA